MQSETKLFGYTLHIVLEAFDGTEFEVADALKFTLVLQAEKAYLNTDRILDAIHAFEASRPQRGRQTF